MGITLNLTTWQRIKMVDIVGSLHGNAQTIRKAARVIDALDLTDEEKRSINYRIEDADSEGRRPIRWDDGERKWDIDLDSDSEVFLKETLQRASILAADGRGLLPVFDQLSI